MKGPKTTLKCVKTIKIAENVFIDFDVSLVTGKLKSSEDTGASVVASKGLELH